MLPSDQWVAGEDDDPIVTAGQNPPYVQVGMILAPEEDVHAEHLVREISFDGTVPMARLETRAGHETAMDCGDLRAGWRLVYAFDPNVETELRWPAPSRPEVPVVLNWDESMRRHAEAALTFRRQQLRELFRLRKDRRYRAGALQMAVVCGVISQAEWTRLDAGEEIGVVICD